MASVPGPSLSHAVSPALRRPPFSRMVCGIDGTRASRVAMIQAVALTGPGAEVVFVVARRAEGGAHHSSIALRRSADCLEDALATATTAGAGCRIEVVEGGNPAELLLERAAGTDLLVVGSHGSSRLGEYALGSTASLAVHAFDGPLLVARRPPQGVTFPHRILVAADGSPSATRGLALAARVAGQHGASLEVLCVGPTPHGDEARLGEQLRSLGSEGVPFTVAQGAGDAREEVPLEAAAGRSSLVVMGDRRGPAAIRGESVSARVAHRAGCSVLIAR